MSGKVYRGALIGCGFFAHNHMHGWAQLPGAEIVAVCDLDADRAAAMAAKFGIKKFYTNVDDLLRSEATGAQAIDFVDIATTVGSHLPLVEAVCQHGVAVICQKPLAQSMRDARAMVAAADKASVPFIVHENFRWQKAFVIMREMLRDDRVGKPHFARFSFRHGYDNYKNQPYLTEVEQLSIMDVGLHLFDLARFFLGEVEQLSCVTQHLNPIVTGEDAFTALLAHQNGATSVCDCSFYSTMEPEPFPQTLASIEGDRGTLELSSDYALAIHQAGYHDVIDVQPEVPLWGEKPWHVVQDSVIRFQSHVLDVLGGEKQAQPSGADNLNTLALAFAAYDSAAQAETIVMSSWMEARA
jgi:predicted dehydrogenase